jgi:zinc protease
MAIVAALFPPDHPYHWLTIGAADDLRAASIDDVRTFFRTYYHPGNASIAIAGDIDPDDAMRLADHYFGEIPGGSRPPKVDIEMPGPMPAEVRLLLEDRVELPRLYLAWHTPALFADGDAEMDLMSDVLTHGKTSRLYRSLVYDTRIATEVAASQNSREMSSFFQVVATAAPGRTLTELDQQITAEIDRLASTAPNPDEMERALAQCEALFVHRLQTVGGFGGKSDQLNAYNTFLNDPGGFARDLARYRHADAEAIRGAAARYLGQARRVALSVVPHGRRDLALSGSGPVTVS